MLGYLAERLDVQGEGPDVLWLLPNKVGFVIEAKSRKKFSNALTKRDHGQLLVAAEWFVRNYSEYHCERVSVVPRGVATRAADAMESKALTYDKLARIISDARLLFTSLCESQLEGKDLERECSRLLADSSLAPERIVDAYLQAFDEVTDAEA